MKKVLAALVALAAGLMLFSCRKPAPDKEDSISTEPSSWTVSAEGGEVKVMVRSTAGWTLEPKADYNWVSASAGSGVDGDLVTFSVQPNETPEDFVSEWVFTCGKANAGFKLTLKGLDKLPPSIVLNSDQNVVLDCNKGEFTVLLHSDGIAYSDIKVSFASENSWLKHETSLAGDEEGDARIIFSYEALNGLDDLSETITFSADEVKNPVTVNVVQEARHLLACEKHSYNVPMEGGTVEIPVSANVGFSVAVSEDGRDWLTAERSVNGVKCKAAVLAEGKRSATVTLTQTDAVEGETPLEFVLTVTQANVIVSWAADMTGNRLFPKWDGTAEKLGVATALTLEAMVNVDEFHKEINTIMGIEGMFLLRFGDAGLSENTLQLATYVGNATVDFDFQTHTWYHIACVYTFDPTSYIATTTIYIDGVKALEKNDWYFDKYVSWPVWATVTGVNFSPEWSYESDSNRVFWYGYSFDQNRDLRGKLTELRIWKKALTAEEINAPDHFYTVDPKSEGLYSYWKFTEGQGDTIEDATGNGNKLYGELDITKQSNEQYYGPAGIKWVEVTLPDK